jgi:hypothetical protein
MIPNDGDNNNNTNLNVIPNDGDNNNNTNLNVNALQKVA